MASGKRASMREGPLAALFRKTEEGQDAAAPPPAEAAEPPPEPPPSASRAEERPAPRTPTPQERLRHAFSSDLPDNIMAPPGPPAPRAAEYEWASVAAELTRQPELRVVGVGGGGVNAVNRMIEAEVRASSSSRSTPTPSRSTRPPRM